MTTAPPLYLTGAFEPVADEIDAHDLPVAGALPPELRGRYLAVSALALAAEDAVGPALTTAAITAGDGGMVVLGVIMAAGALAITPLARLRADRSAWATQRA